MNAAQHTPGPWQVRHFLTRLGDDCYVAHRIVGKATELMRGPGGRARKFKTEAAARAAIAKATGGAA